MTGTRGFDAMSRARMIRELTLFLMRNLANPSVGWMRAADASRTRANARRHERMRPTDRI